MKSPTSIRPTLEQFHQLGISDLEQFRKYVALRDEEPTVLTSARRHSEEAASDISWDATPQLISDDEPTVPVTRRRNAGILAVGTCPAG